MYVILDGHKLPTYHADSAQVVNAGSSAARSALFATTVSRANATARAIANVSYSDIRLPSIISQLPMAQLISSFKQLRCRTLRTRKFLHQNLSRSSMVSYDLAHRTINTPTATVIWQGVTCLNSQYNPEHCRRTSILVAAMMLCKVILTSIPRLRMYVSTANCTPKHQHKRNLHLLACRQSHRRFPLSP